MFDIIEATIVYDLQKYLGEVLYCRRQVEDIFIVSCLNRARILNGIIIFYEDFLLFLDKLTCHLLVFGSRHLTLFSSNKIKLVLLRNFRTWYLFTFGIGFVNCRYLPVNTI